MKCWRLLVWLIAADSVAPSSTSNSTFLIPDDHRQERSLLFPFFSMMQVIHLTWRHPKFCGEIETMFVQPFSGLVVRLWGSPEYFRNRNHPCIKWERVNCGFFPVTFDLISLARFRRRYEFGVPKTLAGSIGYLSLLNTSKDAFSVEIYRYRYFAVFDHQFRRWVNL